MSRRSRLGLAGFLMATLGVMSAPAVRADLSVSGLNAELFKARDEVKIPLNDWKAAVRKKTDEEFDTVKAKLAETWKAGRKEAVTAAAAKMAAQRQVITDMLAGDPERLNRLSKVLKEQFDGRKAALEKAGDEFDAAATAFQVPSGADAKTKSLEKLEELTKAALAPISDAEWGKVFESVNTAFATPTANEQIKAAAASVQSFVNDIERGFERIVHCDYTKAAGTLICDGALAISASEISTIQVSGLPHDEQVTVSARVAKEAPGAPQDGIIDPESDEIVLPPGKADKVSVDVHLRRRFDETYKDGSRHATDEVKDDVKDKLGRMDDRVLAAYTLRGIEDPQDDKDPQVDKEPQGAGDAQKAEDKAPRQDLVLIVSGRAPEIVVQVTVGDGQGPGELVTASLPLGYARWGIDTGGFFAVSRLADEELTTEPVGAANSGMVKVRRRDGGHDLSQDTGIFLNLVPRNYPIFALSFGFSAKEDQANTFYLAPSVRFLSFKNRMVASFSLGATMRSVKRFPGLKEDMEVRADDPLLAGKSQFKFAPCAIIQLGFAFGRIPGVQDDK